jgi:hypothetical protein
MLGLARWNPGLAARISTEDHLLEWTQVALLAWAGWLTVRAGWRLARGGRPVVLDVLLGAGFAVLLIGELDLDRRVTGMKVLATRFFVNPQVPLAYRLVAGAILVGVPLGLAVYALCRRAELRAAARRLLREPWGQVVLAGIVLFGLTEVFERPLGRVPGLPRLVLEETLELAAAICFAVGLAARRG